MLAVLKENSISLGWLKIGRKNMNFGYALTACKLIWINRALPERKVSATYGLGACRDFSPSLSQGYLGLVLAIRGSECQDVLLWYDALATRPDLEVSLPVLILILDFKHLVCSSSNFLDH